MTVGVLLQAMGMRLVDSRVGILVCIFRHCGDVKQCTDAV